MSPVEYKKMLCRPVEFKGQGPRRLFEICNASISYNPIGIFFTDLLQYRNASRPPALRQRGGV